MYTQLKDFTVSRPQSGVLGTILNVPYPSDIPILNKSRITAFYDTAQLSVGKDPEIYNDRLLGDWNKLLK